jgi:hypothetical protein
MSDSCRRIRGGAIRRSDAGFLRPAHPFTFEAIFMKRLLGVGLALLFVTSPISPVRADDKDPNAILDKAIKAVGGEEKLKKAEAITWKTKGTITFGGGNENTFTLHATAQGLDRCRREIEGEFGGETRKFFVVLSGDKGWRKFGDEPMEMDDDGLANEKRTVYLEILSTTLVPLKGKAFKLEPAAEEKVDGKPAAAIKVTGPDKKDFTIYFDKESGLPVKTVAKVIGFNGDEHNQETTFKDYKDFGGIKKATKVDVKHDGEDFIKSEVTDFKVLDKVEPKTFAQPE